MCCSLCCDKKEAKFIRFAFRTLVSSQLMSTISTVLCGLNMNSSRCSRSPYSLHDRWKLNGKSVDWLIRLMRMCLFNIKRTQHDNDTSRARRITSLSVGLSHTGEEKLLRHIEKTRKFPLDVSFSCFFIFCFFFVSNLISPNIFISYDAL